MYYVFFGESPPPPVAEAACDVVPDLGAYALAPLSLGAALAGVAAVLALRWVYAKARAAFADACGRCFDEVDADGSGAVDGDELYVAVLLSYLALNRGAPRGHQTFNMTSMFAKLNESDQMFRPCFENSTRAIGSSKHQPHRLRFGRARESEVRPRRPGSPVDVHAGGTRLVAAVKPPPRAAVDAMLAATGSAELSRDQFQAMMRTLARDGASRLAATVSVALVRPRVESKSSTRLQCARMRMF